MPLPLRRLVALVLVGIFLLGAGALATDRLGLEVTTGVSMEPTYHEGDLVVVVAADSYGPGDIVAYRGGRDGELVVLHRIIRTEADGFVFKGDNNQSEDPTHPTVEQIIGREVLLIPWIGGVLSSPVTRGLLIVLALSLVGALMLKPRSPIEPRLAGIRESPAGAPPRHTALYALVALDLLLLIAVVAAFALPSSTPSAVAQADTPDQTGALAYRAAVPVSDTYPTGQVVTGDAVFTKLLTTVDVSFRYGTEAPPTSVEGTGRLDAELSAANGWRTTLPLVGPTPLNGGKLDVTAPLDLNRIRALGDSVSQATGIAVGPITVSVVGSVHAIVVGLDPVDYDETLPLQLTPQALTLANGKPSDTPDGPAVTSTKPLNPPDPPAPRQSDDSRRPVTLGLLGALLAAVVATVLLWPTDENDGDQSLIPRRAKKPEPAEVERVQVSNRAALEQLATSFGRPIMTVGDTLAVATADALYWTEAPPPPPPPAPPAPKAPRGRRAPAVRTAPVAPPPPVEQVEPEPEPETELEDEATDEPTPEPRPRPAVTRLSAKSEGHLGAEFGPRTASGELWGRPPVRR